MTLHRLPTRTGALLLGHVAAAVLALPSGAAAQALQTSFDMLVPQPPTLAAIDGTTRLVYELHLTNFAAGDVALRRIDVIDADGGASLAALADSVLIASIGRPGVRDSAADPRVVAPGTRAVVYFWIPLDTTTQPPRALTHRVAFRITPDTSAEGVIEGARVDVIDGNGARALGPPLRGGPWVAVYDPGMERGHRRVLFAHDGQVRIPARFAIDWMKVDEHGRLAHGDPRLVANHHGFGADVLAVADANIVDVRDGIADSTTTNFVRHGLANASGNYITLDLGDGRFVSYEHLLAGSIRVALGERVQRGQVIARLGYSGNATSPHLHMHVSNGPTPLAGEGVPWVLDEFTMLGAYPSIAAFGRGEPWGTRRVGARRNELPGPNVVVQFGN